MIYERNRPKGVPIENIKIENAAKRGHSIQVKDGFIQLKASSKVQNDVIMRKQAKTIGDMEKKDITRFDFEAQRMKK